MKPAQPVTPVQARNSMAKKGTEKEICRGAAVPWGITMMVMRRSISFCHRRSRRDIANLQRGCTESFTFLCNRWIKTCQDFILFEKNLENPLFGVLHLRERTMDARIPPKLSLAQRID